MAQTSRGIKYPSDYSQVADVPSDMEEMAESIDDALDTLDNQKVDKVTGKGLSKNDFSDYYKQQVDTNTENINTNTDNIEELILENQRLKEDLKGLPKGEAEGTEIDIEDSAEMRFNSFDIEGNSEQEATPSPDYPSEVKSCGDNINIFDITKYDYRSNAGADSQINNKTDFRITATMNNNDNCTVRFKILDLTNYAGETLSVKAYVKSSTDTNNAFMVLRQNNSDNSGTATNIFYDESQRTTDGVITLNYKVASTINDSNRYLFIHFYATRGTVCNIGDYVDYKVKLVPNTDAGEYSEYGQGCINEVICNKNLWNINYSGTKRAITYNLSKNKITLNGTSNGLGDVFDTKNYSTFFLKAGTYTINAKVISGSFTAGTNDMALYFKKKSDDKNFVSLYKGINYTAKGTITFTEDDEVYVYSFVNGSNVIFNNLVIEIQMEEGSTETDCVEHQEQVFTIPTQQPFRAIGDTRDKFILKENGKWYEEHLIYRYIFTGNETFTKHSATSNNSFFGTMPIGERVPKKPASNNDVAEAISNYFSVNAVNTLVFNNKVGIGITVNSRLELYICTGLSGISTVSDLKAWLKEKYDEGNPTYVDVILTEPDEIECTSEQTEILNQMYIKAKSYKGVTHIYSNDVVSPNIKVNYKKDIDIMINNLQAQILS